MENMNKLTFEQAAFISRRFVSMQHAFVRAYVSIRASNVITSREVFVFNATQPKLMRDLLWGLETLGVSDRWTPVNMNFYVNADGSITDDGKLILNYMLDSFAQLINQYPSNPIQLRNYTVSDVVFFIETLISSIALPA